MGQTFGEVSDGVVIAFLIAGAIIVAATMITHAWIEAATAGSECLQRGIEP